MGLRQFLVSSLRGYKILIASFSPRSRIVLLLLKSRQGGEVAHTGSFLDFIGSTVWGLVILKVECRHLIVNLLMMLWVLVLLGGGALGVMELRLFDYELLLLVGLASLRVLLVLRLCAHSPMT